MENTGMYLIEFGEYMENMTDSGLCVVQEIVSKYEENF
jgi:hypothetical protein